LRNNPKDDQEIFERVLPRDNNRTKLFFFFGATSSADNPQHDKRLFETASFLFNFSE